MKMSEDKQILRKNNYKLFWESDEWNEISKG